MKSMFGIIISIVSILPRLVLAEDIKVGVPTLLTGDFAILGENIEKTVQTYQKRYLRHPIRFIFEDAKKSGADGLNAYKKLIELDHVNMLIGATSSNGTMAGAPIINRSQTVMISPVTGGSNVDGAGEYIFRIGNSDILNAYQQADIFIAKGIKRVALFTEQTEYTQDIASHFREYFKSKGGEVVFDEDFLPDSTSFKSIIARLNTKKPQAIFMSTQTGLAFGIFIKEFRQIAAENTAEIHTSFVAASNPDAFKAAGEAIWGVKYLAPAYDKSNPKLIKFIAEYKVDHGTEPAITFHTAGTVDALDMLQDYLDTIPKDGHFENKAFHDYLLSKIKNYKGLMGQYSFDKDGNADIGFVEAEIKRAG